MNTEMMAGDGAWFSISDASEWFYVEVWLFTEKVRRRPVEIEIEWTIWGLRWDY